MGDFSKVMLLAGRRAGISEARRRAAEEAKLKAEVDRVLGELGLLNARRLLVERCEACPMSSPIPAPGALSCGLDPFVNIPKPDLIPPKCPLRTAAVSIALDPYRR